MRYGICLLLGAAFFSLLSCKGAGSSGDGDDDDPLVNEINSGVALLSGTVDDVWGSSYAARAPSWPTWLAEKLEPSAWAVTCLRPNNQVCTSAARVWTYSESTPCDLGTTGNQAYGTLTISYYTSLGAADSNCTNFLSNADNRYVTRTGTFTQVASSGAKVITSSDSFTPYSGSAISGGAKLVHTSGGTYTLRVTGFSKTGLSAVGASLYEHGLATTADIVFTGLDRSIRSATSGAWTVIDNTARSTQTFTIDASDPLNWSASCCYPVDGAVDIVTSSGTALATRIEFGSSCGSVTATLSDSSTQTVDLASCE